jgi:hypothetical protein
MRLKDAVYWARWHMNQHGLNSYNLLFYAPPKPCGFAVADVIALSLPFALTNSMSDFIYTVRHEISHALAPEGAGHSDEWKKVAHSKIGIPAIQYHPDEKISPQFDELLRMHESDEARFERGRRTISWIVSFICAEQHEPERKTGITDLRFIDYWSL